MEGESQWLFELLSAMLSFRIFLNLLETIRIFWNLWESFGFLEIASSRELTQAHANSRKLMRAQMLRMCSGDARAMLKMELVGAIRSLNCSFSVSGAP